MSDNDKAAFQEAAKLAGMSLAAWMRAHLRAAAIQELSRANRPIPFLNHPPRDLA